LIRETSLISFIKDSPNILKNSIFQGVEKEGLRVNTKLELSKLPHPLGLGSKLTHPFITTDYSENLLEYITSVYNNTDELLLSLKKMHCFTYHRLEQDEVVWPWSMPAHVPENEMDIPVAYYGESNVGKLKELYRVGLGNRYGKSMQSIAGVHYNFSLSKEFWISYKEITKDDRDLQDVINDGYFHLIRNYRRYSWVLIYLFGSTPVVDETFLKNKKHTLEKLGKETWGKKNATSLRMGGLGYTSNAQKEISICYNALDSYIQTLEKARQKSYSEYEKIGVKVDGEYNQLNTNLLQIDNEFYSTIRPKAVAKSRESALQALHNRGIEYIEVRLIDVNPFVDTGIDEDSIQFLHSFLLGCLFMESPVIMKEECEEIDKNFLTIVNEGRKEDLELTINGKTDLMKNFAFDLFESLKKVSDTLDSVYDNCNYKKSLDLQIDKFKDPNLLPSQKILDLITDEKSIVESIGDIARGFKDEHLRMGIKNPLQVEWNAIAKKSIDKQKEIEDNDKLQFDDFLVEYFENIKIIFKG
jgi:glutamate--cysteine ligase